jgi:hypothetical protein
MKYLIPILFLSLAAADRLAAAPFSAKKTVIPLEVSAPEDSSGSIITADVNDDGAFELLVTAPGYVGVYRLDGRLLWSKKIGVRVGGQSESQGLPGHHGPGIQAGDIDGDQKTEVLFLDQESRIHILEGAQGSELWSVQLSPPKGAERWEHLVIADFRGTGDHDLLLQATNSDGYRMGRYLQAHAIESLRKGEKSPLWSRDDYLDGDGRDEVLGPMILGPSGETLLKLDLAGHIDSVFVEDVRPDLPGLEVVMLEEGRLNRVFLAGKDRVLWETDYERQEPQNAAIGRFLPGRDDIQVWCRSRYNEHQKPFVFDSGGKLIAHYEMDDVAPEGWTASGVEVINSIHWTGEERAYACAKERHESGDVCIFDPISGEFLLRLPDKADRLYVADISGDWREEIVVWNGNELNVYANDQENSNPSRERLWSKQHYRRSKMTWNYYSP